jgi:hypothetical protein
MSWFGLDAPPFLSARRQLLLGIGEQPAALVWRTSSTEEVRAGVETWADAARDRWVMDAAKAERVSVLIAIDDNDEVVGAWSVTGVCKEASVPRGKTRKVNRAVFDVENDTALDFLLGLSPWPPRRNPQTTLELPEAPGVQTLITGGDRPQHGVVQLGHFKLAVCCTRCRRFHSCQPLRLAL